MGRHRRADRPPRADSRAHRLGARRYSLSALQKYANCPYQFLLSAIHRLRPADDLEPLQRMDPLTRGSLFHEMQTGFYGSCSVTARFQSRRRTRRGARRARRGRQGDRRSGVRGAVAAGRIASGTTRSPRFDAICACGSTNRDAGGEWIPIKFEWAFGYSDGGALAVGRDPTSRRTRSSSTGGFSSTARSIWSRSARPQANCALPIHKTGKYRGKDHMIVDGGKVLQPVLYSLALEAALHRRSSKGRLYYATTVGGYRDVRIRSTPAARRAGIEVLEIIDRGIENGFLAPALGTGVYLVRFPDGLRHRRRMAGEPQAAGTDRGSARPAEEAMTLALRCPTTWIARSSTKRSTTRSSSKRRPARARPPSSCSGS
jgi:hypothetical protein